MNQIVGIEEVTDKRVFIVNIPEVPSYPRFPAIIMNKASWSHTDKGIDIDVGFLNLPIIRQMIVPHEVKKSLRKWVKKNNTDKVILSYSTNPMSMSALVQLKKEDKNLKIVLVVGDLIGDKGINIMAYAAYTRAGVKYVRFIEADVMGAKRETVGLYNPTAAQTR